MHNIDDDMEWGRWMALTEAEQNAELDRAQRAHAAFLDSLSAAESYAYHRGFVLKTCAGWRRLIRQWDLDVFHDHLRTSQKRLLELRAWRATGIEPGHA